jgi:hypothetical protein
MTTFPCTWRPVVRDRAGQRAAEHPVTGHELAHAVTDLIHDPDIGIFTVASSPEHEAMAARLLNLLMDGLRSSACGQPKVAERQ